MKLDVKCNRSKNQNSEHKISAKKFQVKVDILQHK